MGYMDMRKAFTQPGTCIYYYKTEWAVKDLAWADFRSKVLGGTDPKTADEGSLRNLVFKDWENLKLKAEPNTGDNGVHASASPFEALAERGNWLGADLAKDPFGKALLNKGVHMKQKPDTLTVQQKAKDEFKAAFGLEWSEALKQGLVYNAVDGCKKLDTDFDGLNERWSKLKKGVNLLKFGGGFYCAQLDDVYVINGFYMDMRKAFTQPGTCIYYFKLFDSLKLNAPLSTADIPATLEKLEAQLKMYNDKVAAWEITRDAKKAKILAGEYVEDEGGPESVNPAFVFIKPHAVTDEVKALVKKMLAEADITILAEGAIKAEKIDKEQ